MDFTFLKGKSVAFYRSDAEQAEWTEEEMSLLCTFPVDRNKLIERGMVVLFKDPADNSWQAYEIRSCSIFPGESYQQFTAESIAISELTDCHIADTIEFTNVTAGAALKKVLTGTGWEIGTNNETGKSSGDVQRGSAWEAVTTIAHNWNVYIMPRVTVNSAGIAKRYLDILPSSGVWRGLRLSIDKNVSDPCVTYDDSDLYTALFGYGASYTEGEGDKQQTLETNFANVVWTKTSAHPAKPKGQKYIEMPDKTALYGRNGKPRFGYYQSTDIDSPTVLLQKTYETLLTCCDPKISITGTVTDLYRMGYADQPLKLHDMAIVELKPAGIQVYKQIIQLTVNLLDPTGNTPTIGDYIPNIIYINRQTDDDATGGGRGVGGGTNSKKKQGEFETHITQNERTIKLWSQQTEKNGDILRAAGIDIDAETGVVIYHKDVQNGIESRFETTTKAITAEVKARKDDTKDLSGKLEVLSNKISLVVTEKDGKGVVNTAAIVAGINNQRGSYVKIKADTIDIDGLIEKLEAKEIGVGSLTAEGHVWVYKWLYVENYITTDEFVQAKSFMVHGDDHSATWKSATLDTFTTGDAHYFLYASSAQSATPSGSVYARPVTQAGTKTIYYLGHD